MIIIETSIFTRQITELFNDDEYRLIQIELLKTPDAGDLIPQGGGLRKLRCSFHGKGKRSGARVIYYYSIKTERALMLFIYAKNEAADLTADQLKVLSRVARRFKNE